MLKLTNTNGNVELKRGMMKGDDGGYYIPSINENGELTWTPSEEGMEPVTEKVGIVGPKGEPGEPGFYVGTEEPTGEELVWINPEGTQTSEFATIKYVDESIAKVPGADLTGLATEEFVNSKIAEIEIPEVDLTGYAKISDIPDISNNATYEYVDNAVAAIEIPDTSGFASTEYVDKAINEIELLPGPKGEPGEPGPQGENYVLTNADMVEIADLVVAALPVYNGEVI